MPCAYLFANGFEKKTSFRKTKNPHFRLEALFSAVITISQFERAER
jgi:hypothetical protein